MQLNFFTGNIRTFMRIMHNGDSAKLKILSFILQRQLVQPSFMNDALELSFRPRLQRAT